ncbi:MAG: 30S ribosomal protein S8 [Candidatus Omnitrophica bacterium]|nr:30S ribosomal protein S8 [Candidatus Omnitrophota bacterium]
MPVTDFVADFLTVLRNASSAKKDKVTVPTSKMTTRIADILKEEGFVTSVKPFNEGNKNFVRIHLKYIRGKSPAIRGIKRVSKPGLRTYKGSEELPRVQGGLGIAIISTSRGVVTDKEARKLNVGGELLCKVW